jgi:hypothetical protein
MMPTFLTLSKGKVCVVESAAAAVESGARASHCRRHSTARRRPAALASLDGRETSLQASMVLRLQRKGGAAFAISEPKNTGV